MPARVSSLEEQAREELSTQLGRILSEDELGLIRNRLLEIHRLVSSWRQSENELTRQKVSLNPCGKNAN